MRTLSALMGAVTAVVLTSGAAQAAVLYASTAAGTTGELYIINPANGSMVQDIGPLNDVAGQNYPITGLAFNPITGLLYGSTGNSIATTEARLVLINPLTAQVTLIGSFNAGPTNSGGTPTTMADLAFDAAGNLYGVGSIGGPQLYSINQLTGQATAVGSTGLTSTSGGGLAITASGFYGTPTATRFGTYDSVTGAYTNLANPNKPVGGAYAALAYDGASIYGLDLGPDSVGKPTELVIIDATTGAVTDLGPSIAQLDAIAFAPVPEPASLGVVGVLVAGGVAARRRK